VAPQVLQAMLFGGGSSSLRLAALELWAEGLDADPRAQQALFEQALLVSDDVVRAEASARLDETLQRRQRLAGSP
jgi:ribosomal protein L11 methylase PrmA